MSFSWPSSPAHPAALGVRSQWTAGGRSFPPLLDTLTHTPLWLVSVLRMRAYARGNRARATFADIEALLCQITGCPPVEWPAGFGSRESRKGRAPLARPNPALSSLDPSHKLVLTARIATCSVPEAAVLDVGLATAFSNEGPSRRLAPAARMRCLLPLMPPEHRSRWEAGLGLEPPALFRPPEHDAATRAVENIAAREPLDPAQFPELEPHELLDLAATSAVVWAAAGIGASTAGKTDKLPVAA